MYSYFVLNFNVFETYLSTFSYITMLIVKFFCSITNAVSQNHLITPIWFDASNFKYLALNYKKKEGRCSNMQIWHTDSALCRWPSPCEAVQSVLRLKLCWCLQVGFAIHKHMHNSTFISLWCTPHVTLHLLFDSHYIAAVHRTKK